jgi:hypothetical protein
LVQDSVFASRLRRNKRGGAEFQTGGNLLVFEDLKRGTNPAEKGGRPKDLFEMVSKNRLSPPVHMPILYSAMAGLFFLDRDFAIL